MSHRFHSRARAYLKTGFLTLILVALFAVHAEAQATWRTGEDCDTTTTTLPRNDGSTGALLGTTTTASWCPTNTTASEPLETRCLTQCSWNDGGTGASLVITNARNGVTRWNVPAATACTADGAACSDFSIYAGERVTATQSIATSASKLICWSYGQCQP